MKLLDRIREEEIFWTSTPDKFPVESTYEREGETWRITRHYYIAGSKYGTTIVYGVGLRVHSVEVA